MLEIIVVNRKTGKKEIEKVYGSNALALFYGESFFSRVLSYTVLPLIARIPLFSRLYGLLQRRKASAKKIQPFIQRYGIDASEFESADFKTFNDFFIRKLKPECRPIVEDPKVSMPADGRYLVFPNIQKADGFYVKGEKFSLDSFLQDPVLTRRYENGSMMIVRLCPTDYHRFHFPCKSAPSKARLIPGDLYSVNPAAISKEISIFSKNKRMLTEIDSDLLGTYLYIEVGATFVGSIIQTHPPGKLAQKGEEKGYFSFGSSIVLLFEKGKMQFDDDLTLNSEKKIETLCRFGESLGRAL